MCGAAALSCFSRSSSLWSWERVIVQEWGSCFACWRFSLWVGNCLKPSRFYQSLLAVPGLVGKWFDLISINFRCPYIFDPWNLLHALYHKTTTPPFILWNKRLHGTILIILYAQMKSTLVLTLYLSISLLLWVGECGRTPSPVPSTIFFAL